MGKIVMFNIDSAVAMSDLERRGDIYKFPEPDDSYKYLTFMPSSPDGGDLWGLCSKDMDHWVVCARAIKNDKELDLDSISILLEGGFLVRDCEGVRYG